MRTQESYDNAIRRIEDMIQEIESAAEPMKAGKFTLFSYRDGEKVDETSAIIERDSRVVEGLQSLVAVIKAKRDDRDDAE
ncbi:MAG TPA: hypothetical protein VGN93_13230 [Shinella sp.]|jgi:hypothetical protein|uniref:hypothetical protein n=1 Tax=Shinella sp. TaxID=1870904 RepID=UPI002E1475EA|nr:hypothetical protein [Shinella sp.]